MGNTLCTMIQVCKTVWCLVDLLEENPNEPSDEVVASPIMAKNMASRK